MRLLMLDNEFPPLGGGTGVVNYQLLKELARYPEVSVDLVTSSRSRSDYEVERFSERITIYKVPVDNSNIHHSSNHELIRYAWRGLRFSNRLLKEQRYDLSFAFAGVPAGAISYALKIRAGLPYLVSLQGPDVPGFEARYNYLYPFLKPLLRRVWGNAAVVTAISQKHQELAHQTMPKLAIPVIYNGVDTDLFHPPEGPHQKSDLNILCVGRLIERKGQHHLLRAFACLRSSCQHSIKLTLVGTGDAESQLRGLARELNLAEHVDFAGFVVRQEMPTIYRQADIFVLPSQSEGMSIALLEAMASGIPVVVTDTGGTDELIVEGENGLIIEWADIDSLTLALGRLVEEADLRRRMGASNRRTALAFSWQEITRQYLDFMASVKRCAEQE